VKYEPRKKILYERYNLKMVTSMENKKRLFFSTMTMGQYIHRLNGRAGAIRGWIEILKDIINENKSLTGIEEVQMALSDIELKAGEILSFTDVFKEYLLNSETVKSESEETFLIQDLINRSVREINKEKIRINLDIEDGNVTVIATQSLFEVFTNLLTNSVDAMPDGGEITVKEIINKATNMVEILIADTGIGVPANIVNNAFQPYTSTKLEKGHGLGLWWSKAYIEFFGGKLELVSSDESKGTTFKLTIPISGRR
jgi:two-component system NtrC family sensor kinase